MRAGAVLICLAMPTAVMITMLATQLDDKLGVIGDGDVPVGEPADEPVHHVPTRTGSPSWPTHPRTSGTEVVAAATTAPVGW